MFRKLSTLALLGGAVAYLLNKRGGGVQEVQPSTSPQQYDPPAPESVEEVRSGQTEATIEAPIAGAGDQEESVIPDTSAEDPLVREQEQAAAADAGAIGGDADAATADTDPAMRPVVEGAGDAPETFETTEEQGR